MYEFVGKLIYTLIKVYFLAQHCFFIHSKEMTVSLSTTAFLVMVCCCVLSHYVIVFITTPDNDFIMC